MKIVVSEPKKSMVTIKIESEEADLLPFIDSACKELALTVKIPGFRPGKVPHSILEQHLGKEAVRAHVLETAIPRLYAKAVVEKKVPVVAKPEVTIIGADPFVFEAIVAVLPVVTISGYEKIKIPLKVGGIEEKDVEDLVAYLRKQQAEYTEVERIAKMGDQVEINFEGFDPDGDIPLEGTASKNHPVILGEKTLIPGFEEKIVGMKSGEEKTFELKFPKDYHSKKFAGQLVKFKVKVNKVNEVKLPDLTDEWVKATIGEGKTLEDLRADIRINLEKRQKEQERLRRENKLFEELLALAKVDIPEVLIEEEIDFVLDRHKMEIIDKGLPWDQYLKYLESLKRDLRQEKREQAEKQVKLRLILQHLCNERKIEIEDEKFVKEREVAVAGYPISEQKKVEAYFKEGAQGYIQLQNQLRIERLINDLLS
ncbi:MAG: trigger factor, trigger factor [Candidatus Peregrinibacteria bacterium GW2011_GWE2_39_6]|nr:MAG: trigger factor, trigger factor [Candidatus Peregrinibacteria bacterium GW2011_GWF2_39_17]KKR26805.1 MAG: trigger factor, trigger factor [Candidatus Peregrinibacteria bacterium GW2011_GWE2_39_6]